MASIKDVEILRVVKDIRRRNGLPDLLTKLSTKSRSATTSSSKSSKEKTQLREEVQLPEQTEPPEHRQPPDEQVQLPAVQIFEPVVQPTVTQSETKNVSLPISYGRKSSKSPNHVEKKTPNAAIHRSVPPPLLRLKKNKKVPPAVNTSLLDCSTSGYDSPTRYVSSNDTLARSSALSSRTPKSIQRFSFLCSEVFACNHTEEADATIDTTSSSDSVTEDDRSWKSNSTKRQALAKRPPSFFREVYDEVVGDRGGGIEEEDTILGVSPRNRELASYTESCDSSDNKSSPMSAAPGKRRTRHARTIHSIMKILDNPTDFSSESTNDKNETDDEDDDTTNLSQSLSDGLISVPSGVYAYRHTLSSTSTL